MKDEMVLRYALSPERHLIQRPLRKMAKALFLSGVVVKQAGGWPVAGLARYWRWQLARRVHGGSLLLEFSETYRMTVPSWSEIGGMIMALGSHEPMETAFLDHLVRAGDLFIDVGANIGFYTLRNAAAGATVLAFEPGSAAFATMQDSIGGMECSSRIKAFRVALADWDGEGNLTRGMDVRNHLVGVPDADHSEPVSVRRLDGLLARWGLTDAGGGQLVILKVDAEGNDLAVLQGASRLLSERKPVVLVEAWAGGRSVRDFLAGFGYRVFAFHPAGRSLVEYPADWDGQANLIGVADTLASVVRRRLERQPRWLVVPPEVVSWV